MNLLRSLQLLTLVTFAGGVAEAEEPREIRSFYFGNSLTNQMLIDEHPTLAAAKGDVWVTQMCGVAGGRLQQYVDGMFPDLDNLDVEPTDEKWLEARKAIEEGDWDVVVIQPHQVMLEQYANWLGREIGDIHDGGILVNWIATSRPESEILMYQPWTTPRYTDSQEEPEWDAFDYETYWLRPYSDPPPDDDPFPSRIMRTQDYHNKLRQALQENQAEALGDRTIKVIPVGDALLELERRLKAGTFVDSQGDPFTLQVRTVLVDNEEDKNFTGIEVQEVPFENVNIFYQDFQHHKAGLPRFFHSQVFYATIFGKKPVGLDYAGYNVFPYEKEDGTYSMESSVNWRANDNRHFIEITPELAEALGELVWDVVTSHPHSGVGNRSGTVVTAE